MSFRRRVARARGKWRSATPRKRGGAFSFRLGASLDAVTTALSSGVPQFLGSGLIMGQGDLRPTMSNPPQNHTVYIRQLYIEAEVYPQFSGSPSGSAQAVIDWFLCVATPTEASYMNLNNATPFSTGWPTDDATNNVRVMRQGRHAFTFAPAVGAIIDPQALRNSAVRFSGKVRIGLKGAQGLYLFHRVMLVGAGLGASATAQQRGFWTARVQCP